MQHRFTLREKHIVIVIANLAESEQYDDFATLLPDDRYGNPGAAKL
jgi:hypothetical protein